MNYICPGLKKIPFFFEDALVGFGGFFLYVLTAERILVINDLGPQYQDLRHMEGGGENAPTLQPQEHFSCSQDFRCRLYGLLIFTFLLKILDAMQM